jgi:hypothetical protein
MPYVFHFCNIICFSYEAVVKFLKKFGFSYAIDGANCEALFEDSSISQHNFNSGQCQSSDEE